MGYGEEFPSTRSRARNTKSQVVDSEGSTLLSSRSASQPDYVRRRCVRFVGAAIRRTFSGMKACFSFAARRRAMREPMETTKTGKLQRITLPEDLIEILDWHVKQLP